MYPPMWAHWRHLMNTIELVHPSAHESTTQTANRSVQPFLHSSWQEVPILYNGRPYPPELPFPMRGSGPHLTHDSLRAQNPKGTSICSAVFAQLIAECLYTLQWFTRFCLKIAHSHGGIWTPCNTWFLGPTRILNPNGNSVASAVFAGLASVTY